MVPTKVIGRYEILEELGHGAMGTVFKAHDPAMGRTVAIKTILATALSGRTAEEYRARFQREAHAAGCLAHPAIVPVFDVGEYEGTPFLVMEYVEGRTLSAAAWSGERFTLDRSCEVAQQIAEALGYAHRKGVVHRDIKPANILMTSPEAYGSERPRITDFGVAKLAAGNMTSTGQLLGTPAYMPPEQFTGAAIDGRADLFSLGVILYGLATGEQPFPGETMTAVSYKVVHTEPVPPRKFNPAIPQRLEEIILKCLAKSPDARFQTGEELAQELADLRGVPITASGVRSLSTTPLAADATIDGNADGLTARLPQTVRLESVQEMPAPSKPKRNPTLAAGVAVTAIALVALGAWLVARNRTQAGPQAVATAAPSAESAVVPAAVPVAEQTQPPPVKPSAQRLAAKPALSPLKSTAPRTQSAPAAAAIDPHTLDPGTNAKLKIDFSHIPNGLPFSIEMNGKRYANAVSGDKSTLDNIYLPPGVHEFRVVLMTAGERKVSNIVSTEFKAKKRKTLRIEFKGPTGPGGAPAPATQLFAEFKQGPF